jgi:GAF domain-containing protein
MTDNNDIKRIELLEKKFEIVQAVSSAIVATKNINTIANLLLELAINYTNAEKGSFMLINQQKELYIHAARGIDTLFIAKYRIKIGEGIAGTVAEQKKAVLVEDIDKDERFKGKKRDRYKTRSFISCPIVSKDTLLGVFNINDKKDGTSFSDDEFSLLQIIANQAAIALENAFLMNQLRTKAGELEETNKKLIDSDAVKTEFLTRISHELRTPLNSIKGAIYYLQKSDQMKRNEQEEFFTIISHETVQLISKIEHLLDFLRIEDEAQLIKKSVINPSALIEDIMDLKALKTLLKQKNIEISLNIKEGVKDIIVDTTKFVQFFINVVEVVHNYLHNNDTIEISVYDNDHVNIKLVFSRPLPDDVLYYFYDASHIFKTAHHGEKLKLHLVKKIAEVHKWGLNVENTDNSFIVHLAISKDIRQKMDLMTKSITDIFTDLISEIMELNICSIMLIDDLTGDLSITSAVGIDSDLVKRTKIKLGDRIAGWVASEGQPLLIADIEDDDRFGRKNIPRYNSKSLLSVPLKSGDKVLGVLNLNNKKTSEPFTQSDLYISWVLSERISFFIEKINQSDFSEADLKDALTSFENLLEAARKYTKKQNMFPDLTLRVMEALDTTEEDKKIALYISLIYDLGLVAFDESIMKKKKKLQEADV